MLSGENPFDQTLKAFGATRYHKQNIHQVGPWNYETTELALYSIPNKISVLDRNLSQRKHIKNKFNKKYRNRSFDDLEHKNSTNKLHNSEQLIEKPYKNLLPKLERMSNVPSLNLRNQYIDIFKYTKTPGLISKPSTEFRQQKPYFYSKKHQKQRKQKSRKDQIYVQIEKLLQKQTAENTHILRYLGELPQSYSIKIKEKKKKLPKKFI